MDKQKNICFKKLADDFTVQLHLETTKPIKRDQIPTQNRIRKFPDNQAGQLFGFLNPEDTALHYTPSPHQFAPALDS